MSVELVAGRLRQELRRLRVNQVVPLISRRPNDWAAKVQVLEQTEDFLDGHRDTARETKDNSSDQLVPYSSLGPLKQTKDPHLSG